MDVGEGSQFSRCGLDPLSVKSLFRQVTEKPSLRQYYLGAVLCYKDSIQSFLYGNLFTIANATLRIKTNVPFALLYFQMFVSVLCCFKQAILAILDGVRAAGNGKVRCTYETLLLRSARHSSLKKIHV